MHVCVCVCIHANVCMCMHLYVCMYVRLCMCVCMYARTYVCMRSLANQMLAISKDRPEPWVIAAIASHSQRADEALQLVDMVCACAAHAVPSSILVLIQWLSVLRVREKAWLAAPASHCKQCFALTSPLLHARGCARSSRACRGHKKHNKFFQWVQNLETRRYDNSAREKDWRCRKRGTQAGGARQGNLAEVTCARQCPVV